MKYTGHKSINGALIIDDGEYWAATYSTSQNHAHIQPNRDNGKKDKTTYSDAAGNISYETSVFRVRVKNGRVRRI